MKKYVDINVLTRDEALRIARDANGRLLDIDTPTRKGMSRRMKKVKSNWTQAPLPFSNTGVTKPDCNGEV